MSTNPRPFHPDRLDHPAPASDPASGEPGLGWEIADLVAVGVLDAVTGQPPVPISVWRATGPDDPPSSPDALYTGLTPRVAAILVAIYTDPGDLILDATDDPTVAGAAGAGGRRYRPFTFPAAQPSDAEPHEAGLVLLRWPTRAVVHEADDDAARDVEQEASLAVCARSLTPDGHCVAILAPPAGGIYRDHARTLISAAARAGLGYLQHVVVITSTEPTPADEHAVTAPRGSQPADNRREHLDLLVLVLAPPVDRTPRVRQRRTT